MTKDDSKSSEKTTQKLVDIGSSDRLTSDSISELSDKPDLLKNYLHDAGNTFSDLIFRLTHEIYTEEKATHYGIK